MRTEEQLDQRAAEQSRVASALAAESLRSQWLGAPNRTHVIESKEN
ncbi:hypothetical protein [Mycobacteroides abscessus]|nr:hypothetical protein [Mycobacteroides abscessus]SLF01714.1 Uncharacterised protein [Mycobacteroides abscessus subsp. massiliense]